MIQEATTNARAKLDKTTAQQRYQPYENLDIDLIAAPWGFGGTDNLAQEGAHALLAEQDLVKQLAAIGANAVEIHPPSLGPFEIQEEANRVRNLKAIHTVNNWLADQVKSSLKAGHVPITFGGDGSLCLGTVAGLLEYCMESNAADETIGACFGIIWISNHLCNSSPRVTKSWNANRMVFTALTFDGDPKHNDFISLMTFRGLGTKTKSMMMPNQIVHFGINHKSAQEEAVHEFYTMEDIEEIGVRKAINFAIDHFKDFDKVHVILDVNALDLSAVSNYSLGQLSYREAMTIARELDLNLRRKGKLSSIDIVEHCPSREAWDKKGETAEWVMDFITNIFGENIFNAARKY
ncbi:MAG: arginase family protein [Cyanobacteria bacterium]|nr:arginase family protein [Cyanobacteriota bacterium]MDA1020886.1 arginase family protein [Cyanobacteriota bacterium]